MALNLEEIKKLKTKLEEEKNELEKRLKDFETVPELGTDVDHFEEEADEAEEFSTNAGIGQAYKERLENVKRALDKIERPRKGYQYGVCEKCQEEIGHNLLSVDPESRFCRNCKGLK